MKETMFSLLVTASLLTSALFVLAFSTCRRMKPELRCRTILMFFGTLSLLPVAACIPTVTVETNVQQDVVGAMTASQSISLPNVCVIVWLLGVAFGLGRLANNIRKVRLAVARGVTTADALPETRTVFSDVLGPCVWGFPKPVLILPECWHTLDERYRTAVLLHEQAHINRQDWIQRLAVEVVAIFFWFNPIAIWLKKQFFLQVEMACDQNALEAGANAMVLAEALLAEARLKRPTFKLALAASAPPLEKRVAALVRPCKRNAGSTPLLLPIAMSAIGVMAAVPWSFSSATYGLAPSLGMRYSIDQVDGGVEVHGLTGKSKFRAFVPNGQAFNVLSNGIEVGPASQIGRTNSPAQH